MSTLRDLLLHGRERLVTLTGVGGCGKTCLALQVASDLRHSFPDGVWLAELASLSDPSLLPGAVASTVRAAASGDGPRAALVALLQARTALLVLDNCEHLIDACASLADTLLSACPNLCILATSREPMQIPGERQYRVSPLAAPDPERPLPLESLARLPSVQLFVERASAVRPDFRLTEENARPVGRICSLLAGIPLAIELAAARARVLSAGQIAGRLEDCLRLLVGGSRVTPTRQQTLRAALDWSYNLLPAPERLAFRRAALFAGGWGLEAAEALCGGEGAGDGEALELLASLVDRSLVLVEERAGEARYRLLEPVRQYGLRLLEESGELDDAWERVAGFYVTLAERAEQELHGPRQAEWLHRLDWELDTIRAVLRWAEERGDSETVLRLVGPLYWYLWMRRHLREGLRWIEAALAFDAAVQPGVRAKGHLAAAVACSFLGEYQGALSHGAEALALYGQLCGVVGLAGTAVTLAHVNLGLRDLPAARALAEEAVASARESGVGWVLGQALVVLGQVVHEQGDTCRAVELHEEAIALLQAHGDSWGAQYAATNLASLQRNRPDIVRATALSSIRLHWERGDRPALAAALEYLAIRGEAGRPDVQVRLLSAAHSLRERHGVPSPVGDRDDVERLLDGARAALGEARFRALWSEGGAMSLEQVVEGVVNEAPPGPGSKPPSPKRRPGSPDALTRREREVARLAALGYTDRQIAAELVITEGTAGLHVHHILEKLGFRSRVQIADWALAEGLIEVPPERGGIDPRESAA